MRILGIDPGYATIGYGIIDYTGGKFSVVSYGAITTPPDMPFNHRLKCIYDDMMTLTSTYKPDQLSIERLYFNTNTKTAIDVAQARGVIILAATMSELEIFEYTPLQVKQSITGYGKAEKHQIMEMTKNFLNLKAVPKPDDTADALALAICQAHYTGSSFSKLYTEAKKR